jgi:hypothetical protein
MIMDDGEHTVRRRLSRFAALTMALLALAGWQTVQAAAAGGRAAQAGSGTARGTGVVIDLGGPALTTQGSTIRLHATLLDSLEYGGGARIAVLQRKSDGKWRRIAARDVDWKLGGSVGHVAFPLRAAPAGLLSYRVTWKNPAGTTHSNVWWVEVE